MKPKPISITHSQTNSQQISTPSWGVSNNTQRSQFQKMSRLDQLLSRNQEIYQNMRNQLQEISKSNQNIDANINIIKPLYESGGFGESAADDHHSDGYKQSYTFQNKVDSNPSSNHSNNSKPSNYQKITTQMQESTQTSNTRSKKNPIPEPVQFKPKQLTSSPKPTVSTSNNNNVYLQHQPKKIMEKTPNILQSGTSSYHEPDSSPIESQNFMQSIRSNQFQKYKQGNTDSHLDRIRHKYLQSQSSKNQSSREKYQTFEEDPKMLAIDQKQQQLQSLDKENLADNYKKQQTQIHHNQQTQRNIQLLSGKLQLPLAMSIVFIPFNRLYSSPILQQITKNQLILARKSKTQVVTNNCVNRIVNGIKYKNVHLHSEEVIMYERIMERTKRIDDILRAIRERRENIFVQEEQVDGSQKDSVDIGIIGGHNSLKKKIHYALIAHIYTEILNQITSYFESDGPQNHSPGSLLFTIQHQQQQTNGDPSIISYQGELSPSQTQAENQIVYGNIEAVIQQIFEQMKTKTPTPENQNIHRIRVTRLCLQIITTVKQRQNTNSSEIEVERLQTITNTKIISTNKIQKQFIDDLELDIAIWCVNPLFKYYDETYDILQCYASTMSKRNNTQASNSHTAANTHAQITRKETKKSFREFK